MGSIDYIAPKTAATMMKSAAFGRLLAGPVGSGKTTACIFDLLLKAMSQDPSPDDGLRYTRFAIVRQTLKQLKDTVLKDCQSWLSGLGYWKVSENTFHVEFGDVRSEWIFIPLENADDQARLLSMQLTGAWLSECIEMDINVIAPISGRLGRYPSGKRGNPSWYGIIADTNFPTEMTPWHEFMENPPPDWQIFRQPSGLDPEAENLDHLLQTNETKALPIGDPKRVAQGRRYYERFVEMYGEDSDWVRRYVKAQYGNDPSGQGVFRESFKSSFHVVPDTNVIPGYPIIVGQDFGRNPWSVIGQVDHMGRLLIHEEVGATNMGIEKHIKENLRPRLLDARYLGCKIAVVGDPAGVSKGSTTEESCFDVVKRLGLPAIPAPTNDIEPRLRAVEALLGSQTNGGPSLIINGPKCPKLVRAMAGGYRFKKNKEGALKVVPDKNDPDGYSHVSDALQYLALAAHGNMGAYIARQLRPRTRTGKPKVSSAGWT